MVDSTALGQVHVPCRCPLQVVVANAFMNGIKTEVVFGEEMSANGTLRAMERVIDLVSNKNSVNGTAGTDHKQYIAVRPDRKKNPLFVSEGKISRPLLQKYPFLGDVEMDSPAVTILCELSGVNNTKWKIYYGLFDHNQYSLLVDASDSVYFVSFGGYYDTAAFFNASDSISNVSLSIDRQNDCLIDIVSNGRKRNESSVTLTYLTTAWRF
jgi:hypothetical protein